MELTRYVQEMQDNLVFATELFSSETATPAEEKVLRSHAAASQLVLLSVLSDAIETINTALEGTRVEVRLRGREPEFIVVRSPDLDELDLDTCLSQAPVLQKAQALADRQSFDARLTLRMSRDLKAQILRQANRRHISMNTWLVQLAARSV